MPFIAAIDQGTTSSRCILFDRAGTIVAAAHAGWRGLAAGILFVLPSTSPANAAVPWDERLRWFRALRDLVA